jgi:hypothetical protein
MTALQKFRSVAKSTQSTERKWPVIRRGGHRQGSRRARRPLNRFVRRQPSLCGSATSDNASHSQLPACQTILNGIGDLLAYGRQVEKFLFAEGIFCFYGKLPIHRRLVPKVVIPIHVCHCA